MGEGEVVVGLAWGEWRSCEVPITNVKLSEEKDLEWDNCRQESG
jgi:hypothetical protein